MFGYIRPNKMELKLKDIYRYNDLYCSLCHAIRTDYGQIYGCALSYDLTFLLAMLNGLSDDKKQRIFRCPLNPLKKKKVNVSETALRYAAFINYFLMYLKISDDVVDDNSLLKKCLQKILVKNSKYINQYKTYVTIADKLKYKMNVFNEYEKTKGDFDELTNLFGDFFAEIFMSFFKETDKFENSKEIQKLCFNLGKWIYLLDAYDDYLKDIENKKFNLLKMMCFEDESPSLEQIHQRVQGIMGLIVGNMKKSLKMISLGEDYAIIENTILYGCNSQYIRVLKKRYPEYYREKIKGFECNCK